MGTIKDEKDLLVGQAKEKLGELTKNEQLEEAGKEQTEAAKKQKELRKARIDDLENRNDELNAKQNDPTKEQVGRRKLLSETQKNPDEKKILSNERRDVDHLKHYTGIEEKL